MTNMIHDLTGFQRDILLVVGTGEAIDEYEVPHGLGIKRALAERRPENINHGRMYPNLEELVKAGLIEKGCIDKRTNSYELSEKGYYALREHYETLGGVFDTYDRVDA